jgi:signal transduction histidine kinase
MEHIGDRERFRVLLATPHRELSADLERLLGGRFPGHGDDGRHGCSGAFVSRTEATLSVAAEMLAADPYDAVVLDLDWPDASGVEACGRLRLASPETAIVALSDIDDDGLALAVIRRGAQDFVVKRTIEGGAFCRVLRNAIERKQSDHALRRQLDEAAQAHAAIEQQAVELRQQAILLHQINHELEDFAYLASHDLKEPLRGIQAYCEILIEDCAGQLAPENQRRVHAIHGISTRLGAMIENVLTYCRVGRAAAPDQAIEIEPLVRQIVESFWPLIEKRHGLVRIAGPLPSAKIDPALVDMVFGNLITNGLKFNKNTCPYVEIGVVRGQPDTFYVRDNGIGIAEKHHDAIFELFRRLHGQKEYDGTGAGLTIVRKIVHAYGGRIWLQSQPGEGTTFFFTLGAASEGDPVHVPPNAPHFSLKPQKTERAQTVR